MPSAVVQTLYILYFMSHNLAKKVDRPVVPYLRFWFLQFQLSLFSRGLKILNGEVWNGMMTSYPTRLHVPLFIIYRVYTLPAPELLGSHPSYQIDYHAVMFK
jgi:hypothetical protein